MRRSILAVLCLFACTGTADPARPARTSDGPPAAAPDPQPVAPAAPTASPTPPAPDPAASPSPPAPDPAASPTPPVDPSSAGATSWWCTCYARTTAGGQEPVTGCRSKQPECLALERTVANGASGIVARSVTHACREVFAAHPGDKLGARDAWKPSKKPGAWLSTGACLLPGQPNPEEAQPPDLDDVMAKESIGELKWGMSAGDVLTRLGEPKKRGRIEMWEATGDHVQAWTYADGLALTMASATRKGEQRLHSVTIKAPSQLKTAKGLGIGAARADVLKNYENKRALENEPDDQELFIAGSIYGGLFFNFDARGKVSEIFLGAGAE